MDADTNANANADAGGSTIAFRELCSGELIMIVSLWTDRSGQTYDCSGSTLFVIDPNQTALKSNLLLHCLPCCVHLLNALHYGITTPFKF